jgi:hypothetical protein
MTKDKMIEAIMAADKGYKKTGLKSMKVGEVKAIYENLPNLENSADDKGADTQAADNTPEPEAPFQSFCGFDFDPAHGSDCHTECQNATPEQYQRCVDHYQATAKPKSGRASATGTPKKGKNKWGHLNNSQAELIDRCLLEEEPTNIAGIAEFAKARKPRTRHHLLHLKKDWNVKLSITEGGQVILDERFPDIAALENTVEFK